ncbi:HAD family hydrolase, partial [Kineococcus glutinatus]|uniref:HAD family hydrolase n=1 Tax=Kineococcus glutinatus TaxID=1070872 RepID=UPI0031EEB696
MSVLLAASDLDQTLVFSARSAGCDVADLVCVEVHEGRPLSHVTAPAARLLRLLTTAQLLVPATTRTPAQYGRIRLPGPPPRYAVCANGGVLLVDGVPDGGWTERVRAELAGCAPLADVRAALDDLAAELVAAVPAGGVPGVHVVPGLFAYCVLRPGQREALGAERVQELAALLAGWGYGLSVQGRKVYAVPRGLTKSAGVAEVVRRTGAVGFVAAGDSLLDVDLLLAARAGVRPRHG